MLPLDAAIWTATAIIVSALVVKKLVVATPNALVRVMEVPAVWTTTTSLVPTAALPVFMNARMVATLLVVTKSAF